MVQLRDDIVGLDAAILMAPKVWEASGHVATFTDPLVDCRNCKERFRADHLPDVGRVPELRRQGQLHRGAQLQPDVQDATSARWRTTRRSRTCGPRPRRASSSTSRTCRRRRARSRRSASRRSASRSATRSRPATSSSARVSSSRWRWSSSCRPTTARSGTSTGCRSATAGTSTSASPKSMLRIRPHDPDELSHYSAGTSDVEFVYPWGWGELEGIANRTDFDLTQHAKFSGEDLTYFDQENDRALRAVRDRARGRRRPRHARVPARRVRRGRGEGRRSARCCASIRGSRRSRSRCCRCRGTRSSRRSPTRSPTRCAAHFMIDVDDAGSIGRRYRRQDEVGTPLCVTVDFDSLDDHAVTVRDRDTMEQDARPARRPRRRAARRPTLSAS